MQPSVATLITLDRSWVITCTNRLQLCIGKMEKFQVGKTKDCIQMWKSDRKVTWLRLACRNESSSLTVGILFLKHPLPLDLLTFHCPNFLPPLATLFSLFFWLISSSQLLNIGEFQGLIYCLHLFHILHPPTMILSILMVLIIIYMLMTLKFISLAQTLLRAPNHKSTFLFHISTWPSHGTSNSACPKTELIPFP
jgi:hypothetical protein